MIVMNCYDYNISPCYACLYNTGTICSIELCTKTLNSTIMFAKTCIVNSIQPCYACKSSLDTECLIEFWRRNLEKASIKDIVSIYCVQESRYWCAAVKLYRPDVHKLLILQ
jgi:hypothetical protein